MKPSMQVSPTYHMTSWQWGYGKTLTLSFQQYCLVVFQLGDLVETVVNFVKCEEGEVLNVVPCLKHNVINV